MPQNKNKVEIKINKERCKGCLLCLEVCQGKALALSGKMNEKGYRYLEVKFPEKCTGCGLCFIMCPDSGIEIRKEE